MGYFRYDSSIPIEARATLLLKAAFGVKVSATFKNKVATRFARGGHDDERAKGSLERGWR